ncbi:right-handed parallel beta-helix repeat-containing protein [Bacteroides finegoldii]|uniref:right-handed parallel beta-helix repeat-containing protein n=1 Tax=Bacteroides finegoldii TaxID=338188 RepID=UPI0018A0413D|nr:right-handed parallel beta-helix repeat-containing protein [Bacteroides finegoldii]
MRKLFLTAICILCSHWLWSGEIWVSPKGNDFNDGTRQSPKATLTAALRQAREWRRTGDDRVQGGITVYMEGGTYALYEPVFIRPEDSGTKESPTVIRSAVNEKTVNRSAADEKVVLSGGVRIKNWKKQGKLWVADVPAFNGRPLDFRQLWVNGEKAVRARDVEDFEKMNRICSVDEKNEVLYVPAVAVRRLIDNKGKMKAEYAEMVLHQMWCVANLRIRSIEVQGDSAAVRFHQPESRIQFEHPWPRPMVTTDGHNSAFYLTNARELLDVPGEWYHDMDARRVYYYPREGEKMQEAEVMVPAIETLVQVEGTLDRPVCHIRFEKITFSYTTWMRPSEKGHVPLQAGMYLTDGYRIDPKMQRDYLNHPLDNQGWLGRPAAAVRIAAARQIDFERCRFEHLGSTGLDYEEAVQGGIVRGCLFRDIAGNGLLAGSFSPAAHETHLPYDPADHREVCTHQQINNCYFTEVGNEDWGCLAIAAGYVSDINIEHNEISEVPYSGISLGWGWTQTVNCMRNNRVHANLIHHYAKHMYDVAGIYTLGSQPKSYVTENCVHSIYKPGYVHDPNHWFYLYTDEGSSFITVRDNWTEGEKYLQNANGPGNVWENNGPKVDDAIRERAGLEAEYKDLLNIR